MKACVLLLCLASGPGWAASSLRLPDHPLPYQGDQNLPRLTPPIIQIGDPFLQPGNIDRGFRMPTGAIWQPRFWVFGSWRTAVQTHALQNALRVSEIASRLDLFGNLQLTGTERVLVGIQPLNRGAEVTRYQLDPDEEFTDPTNARIRTLFFEGDFGELFPALDKRDFGGLDTGFSIGRQPLRFQDGLLLDDIVDAVGLARNNLRVRGWDSLTNLRLSLVYGWGQVHRADHVEDRGARLAGLFTAWDLVFGNRGASTVEFDLVHVTSASADALLAAGIGATQRLGKLNSTVRLLASHALGAESARAANGRLLFLELSGAPFGTHNLLYGNGFWANEDYRSAARDVLAGGPLGRVGLLFAARGLGTAPAPLNSLASDAVGGAVGYQMFFANNRCQLVLEIGGRRGLSTAESSSAGAAFRLRQALGRRWVLDLDLFAVAQEDVADSNGARLELLLKL